MRRTKRNHIFIIILGVLCVFVYTYFQKKQKEYRGITSFEECVKAGYEVTSSYPEVCKLPGKNFQNPKQKNIDGSNSHQTDEPPVEKFLTVPYLYNGETYYLSDSSKSTSTRRISNFRYTGSSHIADVNNDTIKDTILLLQFGSNEIASTSPYYLAASIKLNDGVAGSNIIYIDRNISIPSILFKNGMIYVNYTINNSSTTKEKHYIFENDILKERK